MENKNRNSPSLAPILQLVQEQRNAVLHELVDDELGGDHRPELDAEVVYVLLHERDVEQREVRVEGLDDEKFNHERCKQNTSSF